MRCFFLIIAVSCAQVVAAGDESKLKLDGYVVSNLKAESIKNGEVNHQGMLELESKRKNSVKAVFGVRIPSSENDVTIREAAINKKFSDGGRLEFGYTKKRFGLEYDLDKQDRATIDRSPLYRRLEIFTFVGRESQLRYYKTMKVDEDESGYSLALAYSEARNTSAIGSFQKPLNGFWSFNCWLQVQLDHIDGGQQLVWAAMHSFERRSHGSLFQLELLAGMDPEETELRTTFDFDQKVYFGALKLHYDEVYKFKDDIDWIQWVLESTVIVHDSEYTAYNSIQLLTGINYGFEPVRLALNLELIGTSSRLNPDERSFAESTAKLELLYNF